MPELFTDDESVEPFSSKCFMFVFKGIKGVVYVDLVGRLIRF